MVAKKRGTQQRGNSVHVDVERARKASRKGKRAISAAGTLGGKEAYVIAVRRRQKEINSLSEQGGGKEIKAGGGVTQKKKQEEFP